MSPGKLRLTACVPSILLRNLNAQKVCERARSWSRGPCSNYYYMFGMGEPGHFKCDVHIDSDDTSASTIDYRPPPEGDVFRVT